MQNLINILSANFAKQITEFQITEVFFCNGEIYVTSTHEIDQSLEDAFLLFLENKI
jgi:hypothetical protein